MSVMNYKDGGKSNPEILMFGPHVVMSEASDELIETLLRKGNEIRGKEEHDFTHGLAGRIKEEYQYYGWNEWFVPLFHKHVIEYVSATPRSRSREQNTIHHIVITEIYLLLYIQVYLKNYILTRQVPLMTTK